MASQTEGNHRGGYIVSEPNGDRGRDIVTIASGEVLQPGHVLGKVTSSGEYKSYNPGNADGSETAVAVSYDHVDATGGTKDAVITARSTEVNAGELVWFSGATGTQKTAGMEELAAESEIISR